MHICRMCLLHTAHHQHVSVAVVPIIRVTYRNVRNANILSKPISKLLDVATNVLNFLHSHCISLQTNSTCVRFF